MQTVNHATGHNTWRKMPADYDYNQELARAAFADMLHDSERNSLYFRGLEAAIKQRRSAGQEVHVLDIGTGTGLLSMMAASLGADTIVACEEFRPMAECAERVIRENGYWEKIKLVRKRSTELTVGPGRDMEQRANILVTEVFDTELIGEGAISTYNHAARELLTEDRLVVPSVARVWAQVVSSAKCRQWSHPVTLDLGEGDHLHTPNSDGGGHASLALHDLQLSELPGELWSPVTAPEIVFSLDLACREGDIPLTERTIRQLASQRTGRCDAVMMWWDCWTDPSQTILLSCAPTWASPHPPASMPWRDHWMQAIYYPRSQTEVREGEKVELVASHDEYSLWFDVVKKSEEVPAGQVKLPSPQPGLHLAMSRTRLGQINSHGRNRTLAAMLRKIISADPASTVLVISEQSILGLLAARLGAVNVIHCCENIRNMKDYILATARHNKIDDRITVQDIDWLATSSLSSVGSVIAEPHFSVSALPWHNLLFWFVVNSLELPARAKVSPCRARMFCLPVHYKDLWKIRAPLGQVEGFKMGHFDKIIESASTISDKNVEPHPLWEYPSTALGPPQLLLELDLTEKVPSETLTFRGSIVVTDHSQSLNGVALWMEWSLDEEHVLSGGPTQTVNVGQLVHWDMDSKQGVHFLKPTKDCSSLKFNIEFLPSDGDFIFKFETD